MTNRYGKKFLILIPAFNEEDRISNVICECRKYLSNETDLLVINDGSTDGTLLVCEKEGVDVINTPFNQGIGNALQTGFRYAIENNYDFLINLDADGQHNPSDLPKFIKKLHDGEYDIIIGSRFLEKSNYDGAMVKVLGIKFFSKLISLLIREKLTDVTSGFRGMNRAVLNFALIDTFNFDYPDADFLLTLHRAGFKFCEIPVVMQKRLGGKSQHRGLKPLYYIFKMLLSIFIILLREKKR
ncbi:MAG: glycosyltransferase family 2 protein [Ignavibacteriales bacterium]|nr:glycosyltransferase family 2 protein [Ignavibacteriales bacterium]